MALERVGAGEGRISDDRVKWINSWRLAVYLNGELTPVEADPVYSRQRGLL